jgi:hypothetical protein
MKALNILNIIGNPIVINALVKPRTAALKTSTGRRMGGKPKIVKGARGTIELSEEKEPPTLDSIRELERLL